MLEELNSASRRVTLADVADHTGFSRALVSIVMRDVPGASDQTRAIVLAAANELGYRPDIRARSLAGTHSRVIGVVFGVAGTFHFNLLDGLYGIAERNNYGLALSAMTRSRDESRAVQTLQGFRFDGLIMLGPAVDSPVMAGKVPMAVIGWKPESTGVDSVRTSDDRGMFLAVEHLAELGHRRIAHIDGGDSMVSRSRKASFLAAMSAFGLGSTASVVAGGDTQLGGHMAAKTILEANVKPSAIIAFNDDVAIATVSLLSQSGITVPKQISVIGWDDTEAARLASPPLTTIAQKPQRLSEHAFERLLARIEGDNGPSTDSVFDPDLIVRKSTSPRE